jgi:Immunity protein 35
MLTKAEALALVSAKLSEISPPDDPVAIVDAHTIEKPFGWVFFYNSKRFFETGNFLYLLFGNGPVIVNRYTGSVEFFGTGWPELEIVDEYERTLRGNENS